MRKNYRKTKSKVIFIITIILSVTITTTLLTIFSDNGNVNNLNQETSPIDDTNIHSSSNNLPNAFYFNYYKNITIDHNQIEGTSNLINFTLLISILDTDLKDDVQSDGDDIAFSNGTIWLDHEIEVFDQNYNYRYARLVAWVRIPSLSWTKDTKIYMYYGNSTMSSRQNPSGVWAGYSAVYHMNQDPSSSYIYDSTSNNYDLTPGSGFISEDLVDGYFGKAIDFDRSISQYLQLLSGFSNPTSNFTLEMWFRPQVRDTYQYYFRANGGFGHNPRMRYNTINTMSTVVETSAGTGYTSTSYTGWSNRWYYYVTDWDRTLGEVNIYIDGNLNINDYDFEYTGSSVSWSGFSIGSDVDHTDAINGIIEEFRIYNSIHDANWIKTEYNNQYDPSSFYSISNAIKIYASIDDFKYYKEIIINPSVVSGTSNLLNFPFLISIFDIDLHNKAQPDGDDIAFYDGTEWLAHEIEVFDPNYNSTHAQLIAWVRIPSLSWTTDTKIYMYYGNSTLESQQHPKGVWGNDYVAVWHLKEDPTGTIYDSTTNNYDGSSFGGMTIADQVDGKIDGSLDFDGSNDRIIIGEMDSNSWTAITLEAWMKMDDTDDDRVISKEEGTGGGPHIWMLGKSGNNLKCRITTDGTGGGFSEIQPSGGLTLGNWHYIAMTWDTSSERFIGYIDGEPVANIFRDGDTITDSIVDVILADQAAGVRQFEGVISETQISKDALSEDWIRTEYRNQNNPNSYYTIGMEYSEFITLKINAFDVNGNSIPNVDINMYKYSQLFRSGTTGNNGYVLFTDVIQENYNFTATITSDIGNHVELVNITSKAILVDSAHNIINLTCNVGSNYFEVIDIDGMPVESGWILVGNSSENLRNCTIDEYGKTRFWWVNSTPYEYNYTVEYHDDEYNPSKIMLASDNITAPNSPSNPIIINVNLTTVNFTVLGEGKVVSGARLILKRSDNGVSIVNLTTGFYGKAILRWLNSSGLSQGFNVNYSLQIDFFGLEYFNSTSGDPPIFDTQIYNFTVNAKTSYEFIININPDKYKTELVSLNPSDSIMLEWGSQLKIRALFNVTKAGDSPPPGTLGPSDADYMRYIVIDGGSSILSGNLDKEDGNIGRYQCIIDTAQLESDKGYRITISAEKSGFTLPEELDIILFIKLNHMILNQSQNDDSPTEVYWLEYAEMSVKPYGEASEILTIEDGLFIGDNSQVQISFKR